jgi:hypothetical protein
MHSQRQFKQQKIDILSKFTSSDSDQFLPENPKGRTFSQGPCKSICFVLSIDVNLVVLKRMRRKVNMKSDMEIYLEDGDMYIFLFLFIEYKVKKKNW